MTSHITTHVLDTVAGEPAAGIRLGLAQHEDERIVPLATGITDADGRCRDLGPQSLQPGTYRLVFATGAYFTAQNRTCFYPQITIDFLVEAGQEHYHVPILLSAYAYTTYRGS